MRHLDELVPDGLEEEEWLTEVERFTKFLLPNQDEAALNWLLEHFPRCMELVPPRRRKTFLKGLWEEAA